MTSSSPDHALATPIFYNSWNKNCRESELVANLCFIPWFLCLPTKPCLERPLHQLLLPSSPHWSHPGSPSTSLTSASQLLLHPTAPLLMPSLDSLMDNFLLRTWSTSPEGITRNCWNSPKSALVRQWRERSVIHLHILKFSLLQHQIPSLTAQTKKNINIMSSFILHCYLRYWYTSPSLTRAAFTDLKMF